MTIIFTIFAIYLITVVISHSYMNSRKEFMIVAYKIEHIRSSFDGFLLITCHIPILNLITAWGVYKTEKRYLDEMNDRNPQ